MTTLDQFMSALTSNDTVPQNEVAPITNKVQTANETIHQFEAAGLGKAPFKFSHIIYAGSQGSYCLFCGHLISYEYHVLDVNGKQFHVGCDCIESVGDAGLISKALHAKKILMAEIKAKKQEADKATLLEMVTQNSPVMNLLKSTPHPFITNDYKTGRELTYFDYIMYFTKEPKWLKGAKASSLLAGIRKIEKKGLDK